MIVEFSSYPGFDRKGWLLTITMNVGGAEILRDHLQRFKEVPVPISIVDETPDSVLRHLYEVLDEALAKRLEE